MNILMINGSPRKEGNTFTALSEIAKTLKEEGIDSEIVWIGTKPMQGCIACGKCAGEGRCIFHDDAYDRICELADKADGLVIGSPVYYAGPNGTLCALLDRVFYSIGSRLSYKPAASVAVCRRSGATATFDRLNKYFTDNNMPVVSTFYWNNVHGRTPGEAALDGEGMQTMRAIASNMAWLVRNLKDSAVPEAEKRIMTNFIR